MCGPVAAAIAPIAKMGLGAASAVTNYNAQVEDFNNGEARWQENYALSRDAAMDEQNQITAKSIQMQTETGMRDQMYSEEGAVAAAEAEASAAGANVEGNSVGEVIRAITSGAAKNRYVNGVNAKWQAIELAKEQRATVTNMKARIASVTRPTKPNKANAFLGIAGAVVGGM